VIGCLPMRSALLLFAAGIATGLLVASAASQARPRMWGDALLQITTDQIPRKVAVRVNDDHWEPYAETGQHRHPGPTIIYVLEGELSETAREGTSALKAGQAVWRAPQHEHNVRNLTGRPARALAIHLDPAP
jgi:quercetin dioxygenase-like cupin family protein